MCTAMPEACLIQRRSRVAGGLLSCLVLSLPAAAFTPKPGAILASSNVQPNLMLLIDPAFESGFDQGQEAASEPGGVRATLFDLLAANPRYRYGVFAQGQLRLPAGQPSPAQMSQLRIALSDQTAARDSALSLAEAHYEISRYMRGLSPLFAGKAGRYTSPIEYRCQANAVAIFTGPNPLAHFSSPKAELGDPDSNNPLADGNHNLPNWRGSLSPYYPAELARFAFEIDLRNRDRHNLSIDAAGKSWDDPDFVRQRMRTFVIESSGQDTEEAGLSAVEKMARDGGGNHWRVSSPAALAEAIPAMLTSIGSGPATAGRGAVSSRMLTAGETMHYRVSVDPQEASGTITAVTLNQWGQPKANRWSTDEAFTPGAAGLFQTWSHWGGGRVVTVKESAEFAVRQLSAPQQTQLHEAAVRAGYAGAEPAAALIEWAQGSNLAGFRSRERLLGDVINSGLRHTDTDVQSAGEAGAAYRAYRMRREAAMTSSLVVGANDGLLHVFNGATGRRRMSFLPSTEFAKLGRRAHQDYTASTYLAGMDGPVALADVHLESRWSTIAVAGMGAGGKGLVALELFNEVRGDEALGALWEKNNADAGWQNLGHTYSTPSFARMRDGRSVVILGNGYGSASGSGSLLVADAETGRVIREIGVPSRAGSDLSNGLSSPLVRRDSTGVVTAVYAGDLHGRLWKFDLGAERSADWGLAFSGKSLFSGPSNQPIAMQPSAVTHPAGGELILFATGKFLEQRDVEDTSAQAIYGVWDRPGSVGGIELHDLQAQSIVGQPQVAGRGNRLVSQRPVDWTTRHGWVLPLVYGGEPSGERAVGTISLRSGRLVFTTGVVNQQKGGDPCEATPGHGWLMTLDAFTGAMLSEPFLDNDANGELDERDTPSAGIELEIGLPGDKQVIVADGVEHYLIQGSEGAQTMTAQGSQSLRRIMWRQLM